MFDIEYLSETIMEIHSTQQLHSPETNVFRLQLDRLPTTNLNYVKAFFTLQKTKMQHSMATLSKERSELLQSKSCQYP